LCTTDLCVNNFCQHNPISCDDGVACTVDTCDPETGLCAHTLNDALCDNSDFCAGEKCDSLAGCVFDHECISDDGNPCPDPTSCNGAANNCGTCLKPTVAANGGRYLTVTPGNQGGTPIALKVVGQCGDSEVGCVASYVQSKCEGGSNDGGTCDTNLQCPKTCYNDLVHSGASCAQTSECPLGDTCRGTCETGLLGAAPYYKTSAQWGTVQVRGVQIRPEKHYLVHTLCDLPPVTLSAAGEATTWVWGDSTGDGGVDALDISRIVDAFKGIFTSTTFQQVNLWGIGCIPDTTIDALDIVNDVDAFRHYPFPCGVTCP